MSAHPPYYLVFDVESVGLHGDGFAVGWVVLDTPTGLICDSGIAFASPAAARGADDDRAWIEANVVPALPGAPTHGTPREVRDAFWAVWSEWKGNGAWLAADVAWPVEARFLSACVDDDPAARKWAGPYPLLDVASVRLAAGFDPLATEPREPGELPAHNPVNDARQSARLLWEAIRR